MREFPVPSKRLILLLSVSLLFFIISIFNPQYKFIGTTFNMILIVCSLADIFLQFFNVSINFDINKSQNWNISQSGTLDFKVSNRSNVNLYLEFGVDFPAFWEGESSVSGIFIEKGCQTTQSINATPYRRGSYKIDALHFKTHTNLGLFYLFRKMGIDIELNVLPSFKGVKEYLKLTRSNRLYEIGIHKNRYKGSGTELDSLREYNQDDDAKYIDWKASSRLNKPVTKQFQMESQNDLVLVLDCGRIMCGEQERLSSLDHAINGVLTLSYVAKNIGDNVRVIAFSDKIHGDLKCLKSGNSIEKVIRFLTPLQPRFVESNYTMAFNYLRSSIGKRSLIVFISDIMDDINYKKLKSNFIQLSRKHLILFLLLKDTILEDESFKPIENSDDLFNLASSRSLYLKRKQAIAKLRHSGIDTLDVLPKNISGKLIDKYLSLKSRNKI